MSVNCCMFACCMCSAAAFLPFLKKKPLAAAPKRDDDDEDPLALPLPPQPKHLSRQHSASSSKSSQFVSKLNTGKAKPAAASRTGAKASNGATRPQAAAPAAKAAKTSIGQSPAAAAAKAAADAEARRMAKLERMARLGALATGSDAPPELKQRAEEAKRRAYEIKQQKEAEERRQAALERQRQQRQAQIEQQRQVQQALQQRLQQEKQRALEAKLRAIHGPNAAIPAPRAPAAAAAAAGAGQQHKPAAGRQPAATQQPQGPPLRQQQQQQQQQPPRTQQPQGKADPFAHLPAKVRSTAGICVNHVVSLSHPHSPDLPHHTTHVSCKVVLAAASWCCWDMLHAPAPAIPSPHLPIVTVLPDCSNGPSCWPASGSVRAAGAAHRVPGAGATVGTSLRTAWTRSSTTARRTTGGWRCARSQVGS